MEQKQKSEITTRERVESAEIADLFERMLDYEPKIIDNFVPSNRQEQQDRFLSGEIRNPNHIYGKLDNVDFGTLRDGIEQTATDITQNPNLDPKHMSSYESFISDYKKKTDFLELAKDFNNTQDEAEKSRKASEYMKLNIELYGEPDEKVYRSLLQEAVANVKNKELSGRGVEIQQELLGMVPSVDQEIIERFKPSQETIDWMHGVADSLYGGLLEHVPEDKESFDAQEIKVVFDEIMHNEFGEAAAGWIVDIEEAKSIDVKTFEKRVVIPTTREVSRDMLRKLVVHELGVHIMRYIMADGLDMHLLRVGLSNYADSEEGLGVVMEQSINNEFVESGVDHYITAGAAYHDGMDFRDIFELRWRLEVLRLANEGDDVSDEQIVKAKDIAYGATMRIMRGTDELPWFKDLAYYNGAVGMWRHLESIKGDDLKFMFVLMGKANPANADHERILLETKSTG